MTNSQTIFLRNILCRIFSMLGTEMPIPIIKRMPTNGIWWYLDHLPGLVKSSLNAVAIKRGTVERNRPSATYRQFTCFLKRIMLTIAKKRRGAPNNSISAIVEMSPINVWESPKTILMWPYVPWVPMIPKRAKELIDRAEEIIYIWVLFCFSSS